MSVYLWLSFFLCLVCLTSVICINIKHGGNVAKGLMNVLPLFFSNYFYKFESDSSPQICSKICISFFPGTEKLF